MKFTPGVFRLPPVWFAGLATVIATLACGGDGGTEPPPPPPPNQPPQAVGSLTPLTMVAGDTATVDVSANFRDPDGDRLTHAVATSSAGVVSVSVSGSVVTLVAVATGSATVTVTATDPGGLSATQQMAVTVESAIPSATFLTTAGAAPEGGIAVLALVVNPAPESPIMVSYSIGVDDDSGTEDADTLDYEGSARGTVAIAAGDSVGSIALAITNDDDIEPTREVLVLTLDLPDPEAGFVLGPSTSAIVTIEEGVCDRTPQVRDEIVRLTGAADCQQPEDPDLAGITELELCYAEHVGSCNHEGARITQLRAGDFRGLSQLTSLQLAGNALTTLPDGVFSGLDELETLWLANNELTTLPEGVFSGLSKVGQLGLANNRLAELPAGLFLDLTGMWWLALDRNPLTELPSGIFSTLSNLSGLEITNTLITELPPGVFVGLASLTYLDLRENPGSPFPLTLELLRADNEDLRAPSPAQVGARVVEGAPFTIRLPLSAQGGTLSGDTAVIEIGGAESETFTVTRAPNSPVGTLVAAGPTPEVPEEIRGIGISLPEPQFLFPSTAPVVSLASSSASAPEGGTAVLKVEVDPPPDSPITLAYSLGMDDDDATHDAEPTDYVDRTGGSVQIAAGATSASIAISITDDDDIEPTREVLTITLDEPGEATDYALGYPRAAQVTIEEGVCDRTPQVRDEIVEVAGTADCAGTDDDDLARIVELDIRGAASQANGMAWTQDLVARVRRGECELETWRPGGLDLVASTEATACAEEEAEEIRTPRWAANTTRGRAVTTLREGDFEGLSNLGALYLRRMGLTELPPGVFAGLRELHWLSLQYNELTTLPEGIFSDLSNLRDGLILANNQLTSLPETVFSGLSDVGLLILEYNQLTEVAPRLFEGLSDVDWLFLNGNRLTDLPSSVFSDLSGLTVLELSQNQLSALRNRAFAGLSSLRSLYLWQNRLTSVSTNALDGLPSLERLVLDRNLLTDLPRGGFSSVPGLKTLSVSFNPLGALEAADFSGTPSLEALYLAGIQLAQLPPGLFSNLQTLETLNLRANQLNELPAGAFLGLKGLKELALDNNPGSPFPLTLEPRRRDSDNHLAAGPATVAIALEQGAPFNIRIPVSVHGGDISAGTVLLPAGSDRSDEVTVTRQGDSQAATQVVAGPPPRLPTGITGIELRVADPLVLFAMVSNRAPVAERQMPWLRMREGGESSSLTVSSYFRDPDGDELGFAAVSVDPGVATASVSGGRVTVAPVEAGSGTITVTATDPGGLAAEVSLPVSVRGGSPGLYDIDLILIDEVSESIQAAFDDAVDYWSAILAPTELPDMRLGEDFQLGCWDITTDQRVQTVEEVVIVASVREIDGRSGILASAGWCGLRDGEGGLPFMGAMQFDVDDLEWREEQGDMEEVILHEMGHVLGIGTFWRQAALLIDPSLPDNQGADTHFNGPLAIAAFDEAGGTDYEGAKVPVENRAGPGSGDAHWRESVLDHELMTPYQNGGIADPLSVITIQSLADLGYKVNAALAEPFRLPGADVAPDIVEPVEKIGYGDDVLRGPIIVVDRDGRVVRVIPN